MARRILGLDLGTHALKAVWVESTFRQTIVRDYRSVDLPHLDEDPSDPESARRHLVEALQALGAAAGGQKADAVHVSLPGKITSTHVLSLPFTDARRIEQTLPFEIEEHLPIGLDEIVFDYEILERGPEGSKVLVVVVRRETLAELLEALSEAGFDPRVVTHAALAYRSLYSNGIVEALPPSDAESGAEPDPVPATEVILDIGASATGVLFLEGGEVRGAQSFPIAGNAMTLAIAQGESMAWEEAEALKCHRASLLVAPGDEEGGRLAAHLHAGLGPLVRALRHAFFAYRARTQHPVTRIHLCGGSARLPGLARHLARELGCEVLLLDPFPNEGMQIEVPPELHDDPTAGLAMALTLPSGGRPVNLRTGEFRFQGDLSYLRESVGKLVALAMVVLGLVGLNVYASFATLAAREAQVDQALCDLTQKVLGQCTTNPDDAISRLKGASFGGGSVPEVAAAEILAAVTQRLSRLEGIEVTEMDIGTTKVRLAGRADSFDAVSKVAGALEGTPCFAEVSPGQTRQAKKSEKIEFNVDASLAKECTG